MKLLRLIGGLDPEHGGPPVSSVNACIAAQRAGADTTFAFPMAGDPRGPLADTLDRLRNEGVEIQLFPYSPGWGAHGESWGVSFALSRWIGQHYAHYDIIHCHGAWQMVTYVMARRAGNAPPIVLTPHESMTAFDIAQSSSTLTGRLKKHLRKYYSDRLALFVMSSHLEARDSLPDDRDGSDRIAVIPHPVHDETETAATSDSRSLSSSGLRLGYLGRLHAKKNVDVILGALKGLNDEITLSIAGDGPERAALEALATNLGLNHRISWRGFIEEHRKQDFFQGIDVLLLPSDYECFGMAAAEAMIRGIPVITTPDTGIAEIILDHGGGDIVAAEAVTLQAAIGSLAVNPDIRAKKGQQAAEAAHKSLSFAAYGAEMTRHYETLLAGQKPSRP